jgi:hypothetical protein
MDFGFKIGDRVHCSGGYNYTIEEIDEDGHLWGSDLPNPYYGEDNKNWHNPRPQYTTLIEMGGLINKWVVKHVME